MKQQRIAHIREVDPMYAEYEECIRNVLINGVEFLKYKKSFL